MHPLDSKNKSNKKYFVTIANAYKYCTTFNKGILYIYWGGGVKTEKEKTDR